MRYVFKRFAEALEIIVRPVQYVRLDGDLVYALMEMIAYDLGGEPYNGIGTEEVRVLAQDMIQHGMRTHWTAVVNKKAWNELTPRERDVTAGVCLGYTNHQIASQMKISHNTVKTHIRHILDKFNVNGKLALETLLRDWDFSEWTFESNEEEDA